MATIICRIFLILLLPSAFALEGDDFTGRYFLKNIACLDSETPIKKSHYSSVQSPQVVLKIQNNAVVGTYKNSKCFIKLSYKNIFLIKNWSVFFFDVHVLQFANPQGSIIAGCEKEIILKQPYGEEIISRQAKDLLYLKNFPSHGRIEFLSDKNKEDFFVATSEFYVESDPEGPCYLHFARF